MGEYFAPVIGRSNTVDDDVLIKSITQLAVVGSSTDSHQRIEVMNTYQTLDDLTEKTLNIWFHVEKKSGYLRLIPRGKGMFSATRKLPALMDRSCQH